MPAVKVGDQITEAERAAVARLFGYAQQDTEEGEAVAAFLLSWWWGRRCGGFKIDEALDVGNEIAADIVTAFAVAMRTHVLPGYFGHKIEPLVRKWRPDVAMELDAECAEISSSGPRTGKGS